MQDLVRVELPGCGVRSKQATERVAVAHCSAVDRSIKCLEVCLVVNVEQPETEQRTEKQRHDDEWQWTASHAAAVPTTRYDTIDDLHWKTDRQAASFI